MAYDESRLRRKSQINALGGAAAWLLLSRIALANDATTNVINHLLLFAVLILVPLDLGLVNPHRGTGPDLLLNGVAVTTHPFAAGLVALAFLLPVGAASALLSVAWLAFSGIVAAAGVSRLVQGTERRL